MSKYHELSARAAKRDWTTDEGVADALRAELTLEGHGAGYQAWRDGLPVEEEALRQAVIAEVTSPAAMGRYREAIRAMASEGSLDGYAVFVEADGDGLAFEHGDFRRPLALDGLEVVVGAKALERRRKRRTKKEIRREDKADRLREKLEDTLGTAETDYLIHANQCGYLVGHTSMRFYNAARGQWGISMMTRVNGITLDRLRGFVDSTGSQALSGVSTHADTSLEGAAPTEDAGTDVETRAASSCSEDSEGILAMHSDFARELIDFLNLELEIDIDGLKAQHRGADSGFQSIGHWGADRDSVLTRLLERRRDLDPVEITEAFGMGHDGELLV